VFCISAFLAGIGGAISVPATGTASSLQFIFFNSLAIVAVLAIAGRLPVLSAFLAAALFKIVAQEAPDPAILDYQNVFFGVAAILAAVGPLRAIMAATARSKRAALRSLSAEGAHGRMTRQRTVGEAVAG
jgi:ABC-type branched-subunit amino acid transport system permease subunit